MTIGDFASAAFLASVATAGILFLIWFHRNVMLVCGDPSHISTQDCIRWAHVLAKRYSQETGRYPENLRFFNGGFGGIAFTHGQECFIPWRYVPSVLSLDAASVFFSSSPSPPESVCRMITHLPSPQVYRGEDARWRSDGLGEAVPVPPPEN
jgi:hypothetical protein